MNTVYKGGCLNEKNEQETVGRLYTKTWYEDITPKLPLEDEVCPGTSAPFTCADLHTVCKLYIYV